MTVSSIQCETLVPDLGETILRLHLMNQQMSVHPLCVRSELHAVLVRKQKMVFRILRTSYCSVQLVKSKTVKS